MERQRAGQVVRERGGRKDWVAALGMVLTRMVRKYPEWRGRDRAESGDRTWEPPAFAAERPREGTH